MTCRNGSHYDCDKCGWRDACEDRKHILIGQLIKSALKWGQIDDDVKENGWTDSNEEAWEYERNNMIALANELRRLRV